MEDNATRKTLGRKLLKKKRDASQPPLVLPERFKDGDDAQEDFSAPTDKDGQNMNQSVFGMIAAAGSKVDFHARFDNESSDSEEETEQSWPSMGGEGRPSLDTVNAPQSGPKADKHKRKLSEYKLLKSLPKLNMKTTRERPQMSQSSRLPDIERRFPRSKLSSREAPIMSQMLQAKAQLETPRAVESEIPNPIEADTEPSEGAGSALALRLKEIFEFEEPENVVAEYPCWFLKSVLLQGYMYITAKHVCFYAYLPRKSNVVAKSGYLSKRGKQNPKFNRYWFTLKGDVLSYYQDPSNLYFPSGNIDLRYGIQASLERGQSHDSPGSKKKDTKDFSVTTRQRTYYFKADSPPSAKEWVRTLQKVIFRSHNDGDSVKISLPIANVIDIEDSPLLGFADTFKIRVVDNDDTFAVDEYFFSFFSLGKDALNALKIMIDDSPAQRLVAQALISPHRDASPLRQTDSPIDSARHSPSGATTPILRDTVKATLSPAPISPIGSGRNSPRPSSDFGRSSVDQGRRSFDVSREPSCVGSDRVRRSGSLPRASLSIDRRSNKSSLPKTQGSSDSYTRSSDLDVDSSLVIPSTSDVPTSASQILNRSDVFQSPTIQKLQKSSSSADGSWNRRHSADHSRPSARKAEIRVHPPSRSQTQSSIPKAQQASHLDGQSDSDVKRSNSQDSGSSPALQDLVKAGSYPLQRAAGFAGFLKNHSKRMSNKLATESMGYIGKVSGMWTGGRRHYDEGEGSRGQLDIEELDDDEAMEHGDRFRAHFALPANEHLQATFFGYLHRVLPLYGKIYVSNRSFCFRSLLPGTRTKVILPLKDIENVDKEKGFRFGYSGLVIVIRGHEEIFFEFNQPENRDDCAVTLLSNLETVRFMKESGLLTAEEKENVAAAMAENQMLQEARKLEHAVNQTEMSEDTKSADPSNGSPVLFDDPRVSIINFKPTESLRITCLTIGSRGDVQPYIALCKGLLKEGHKPKIATHKEFGPWVQHHGIEFAPVEGDPAELMRICVENGMFTYSFLKEASQKFRGWIDELLVSAWTACQNSDVLIESPSAMAGIHIAEALEIPYFRAFTMPWTRTRAYPHAFAVPESKKGGAYNYFTYIMFDNVFWKAISGQINRWRRKDLNLPETSLDKLQPNKVPFLYNFSPSVVVPPLDYSDWIKVTGYWFLDEASDWKAPDDLTNFIKTARKDHKKIVYVGFGSIVVSDPAALTKTIVESVLKADVRCILSKGWSDRLGNKDANEPEIPLPPEILQIKSAPHDWLFRQIDAAAHHGGAGTTGASLRAGLPTIIKPFFGDQFFFGSRVEDLGVGKYIKKLNVSVFARALWEVCHSQRIIDKAKILGEQIREENGVDTAIQAIYRDMEYAKTLIKNHSLQRDDALDDSEESWTFIGDDRDPELARRIAEWEPMARGGHAGRSTSGSLTVTGANLRHIVPP